MRALPFQVQIVLKIVFLLENNPLHKINYCCHRVKVNVKNAIGVVKKV